MNWHKITITIFVIGPLFLFISGHGYAQPGVNWYDNEWSDIKGSADRDVESTVRESQSESVEGMEPGPTNYDEDLFDKGRPRVNIKVGEDVEPGPASKDIDGKDFDVFNENEDDTIFMGDTEEEKVVIEPDSEEYLETRRRAFSDPELSLGAKPIKLTLEDCIRIAILNNNKIQATDHSIDVAKAQLMEAQARFWPVLEYEWLNAPVPKNVNNAVKHFFEGDWTWWNKIRLTMGMPFYSFGKLILAQELAKGGIAAARAERGKQRLSVVTQVRQLYYGAILAKELTRLLKKAHSKLQKGLVEDNGDNGDEKRSPLDQIEGRVFLVDLENRLAEAGNRHAMALETLRVQLGLSPDVAVSVFGDRLKPVKTYIKPLDDYLRMAMQSRPDVKLVEIGLETRRKQYKLEKRKLYPDTGIGAYLDLGRTTNNVEGITATGDFQDPFNFTRAGIGMRVQGQFDIHGHIARVRKARSQYYQASLEHYMAKDGIILDVKKAYMDVETALDDMKRADKAQRLARQMMFLTQSNYELGVGARSEYVNALKLVLFTRGKYFEAVFNYNNSLAILDEKSGVTPDLSELYNWK